MKRRAIGCLVGLASLFCGCGVTPQADFVHSIIGTNGQTVVLDDVLSIVDDPALDADAKRASLRELGIEDERLITALLTL